MTDQKPTISLAQWCAYLPYEVALKCDEIHDEFITKLTHWQPTMFINGMNIATAIEYNAKPLLRPMNDPKIEWLINDIYNSKVYHTLGIEYWSHNNQFKQGEDVVTIEHLPNSIMQALLAAHYDIFNLIPQGLALPIE